MGRVATPFAAPRRLGAALATRRGLGAALLARAGQALLVALVVGVLTFAMMEALPGDAVFRVAASRYGYDFVSGAAAEAVAPSPTSTARSARASSNGSAARPRSTSAARS